MRGPGLALLSEPTHTVRVAGERKVEVGRAGVSQDTGEEEEEETGGRHDDWRAVTAGEDLYISYREMCSAVSSEQPVNPRQILRSILYYGIHILVKSAFFV